jgi:hypothetical protein
MARRTAMSKEPRTESSREGERRMPGKPMDFDDKGNRKPSGELTRVSPGVYRNSQGKLVGSRGQSLGNRNSRPGAEIGRALGQAASAAQTPPIPIPDRFMDQYTQNQQSPGNMAEQIANGSQAGAAMGAFPDYGQARPLTPQERAARGIDPRDPNNYSILPNGQVMGTLMGWMPNPSPIGQSRLQNGFQPQGQPQGNSISNLLRRNG